MKDLNKFTKIYYDEVGREKVLDTKEERVLSERIKHGDRKAADKLVTANIRFVMHMAKKYRGQGVDTEDLVSEGCIALVEAARRYDASHGCRFVSYAAPFVDKVMRRIVNEQAGIVKTPKSASSANNKKTRALSVDAPLGGKENVSLLNVMVNDNSPSPEHRIKSIENSAEVSRLMELLNERERTVITYIYGLGVHPITMAETGEKMGLKRERVRQIRNKALRKLSKHK